jgi:Ribonuclease 2-5A
MCRDPRETPLVTLETGAYDVVGNDWHSRLDKVFVENLGKFRKYDGRSVQDLLRALRNKVRNGVTWRARCRGYLHNSYDPRNTITRICLTMSSGIWDRYLKDFWPILPDDFLVYLSMCMV